MFNSRFLEDRLRLLSTRAEALLMRCFLKLLVRSAASLSINLGVSLGAPTYHLFAQNTGISIFNSLTGALAQCLEFRVFVFTITHAYPPL